MWPDLLTDSNPDHMLLSVCICTLDDGIRQVAGGLIPPCVGIEYVVSWQCTGTAEHCAVPAELEERDDVRIYRLQGRGLSRNRNHALEQARGELLLIADDDERFRPAYLANVLRSFADHPRMDIGLFRVKDHQGNWLKNYPEISYDYPHVPPGAYPCSVELVLHRRVVEAGLRFDEHYGLGSPYLAAGEEDILLLDAMRMGLLIRYIPLCIAETEAVTTGQLFPVSPAVQRSKGAVFYRVYGGWRALWRCTREALSWMVHRGRNPFPLFVHMLQGIRYARRHIQH